MLPFRMMESLARAHEAEFRRGLRPAPPGRTQRRNVATPRERLGWMLVELGLRLAVPPR